MIIANKCVVGIHYTLRNDTGEQLDASQADDPLLYLHGGGNIVAGLEEALEGKQIGDNLRVVVPPEKGYGEKDPKMMGKVPLSSFDGMGEIEPGMKFEAEGPDGYRHVITIDEVHDDEVTINGNHPLAGQTLHFDVTVDSIRAATAEELDHGHVHQHACGHHHG